MTQAHRVQIEKQVADWAIEAWKAGNGDWKQAQDAFLTIKDRDLPTLEPALASAIEDEVWRFFSNQAVNRVVQRFRKIARTVNPKQDPSVTAPTGKPNSVNTIEGALSVIADRIEDLHFLPTCKKSLGDATRADLQREQSRARSTSATYAQHADLYQATDDKMCEAGVDEGSEQKARDVVPSDYFADLRQKIYG